MNPFEFFIPQNITVGAGTLAKLPECAKKLGGSHAMLISGSTLRKMGVVDKAADYLKDAGMAVDIFTDVEANPSVTTVEKRQKRIRNPVQILSLRWAVVLLWMSQKQWELRLNMAAVLQNMRGHIRFPEKLFR